MNKLSSRSFRRSFCFAACAALSKFHILLWHAISTHQREVFERIFNGKLTQFWQSNTSHTVTKASRSYVLALAHSFLKLSWIRVCFLCRGMESRARTTSGPGDRKRSEHGFLIYLSRPPPPPLPSDPWHAYAPRICVMFWVMISSLLWLTSYTARQASNTQVAGEMGSTTRTYIILMRVFCSKGGREGEGAPAWMRARQIVTFSWTFYFSSSSLFSAPSFNPRSLEWPEAELVNYYHVFDTPEAN